MHNQSNHWVDNAFFYHIYPLGLCDAPRHNDFQSPPVDRLAKLLPWLEHMDSLGANALYLGPVFEASTHGYDTADYYHVDRRLGDSASLSRLSEALHGRGMRLVLDAVFNHVGRDFWAFRDVLSHGSNSPYCGWFQGLSFTGRSPYGDPFTYQDWNGHAELVRLNLHNPQVREHLFQAVAGWVRDYNIDGLRLDAADCLDFDFLRALSSFCKRMRPDFWLLGEVIHGDYNLWANPEMLDSVTNYEVYKGLYSSHVEANYFEIAYAFNRQFGASGIYNNTRLYNFADNHDVNRVASSLANPAHLVPLYCLLMTIPGVPSLYYGSEWGLPGARDEHSDHALRPSLELAALLQSAPQPALPGFIARLAAIRQGSPALRTGDYQQLDVRHQQFAFLRRCEAQGVVVAVNAAEQPAEFNLPIPLPDGHALYDHLREGEWATVQGGRLRFTVPSCSARILA
jgi:cyclomaltodextrinase / maltogenic alpha-amylase / neopullulanase